MAIPFRNLQGGNPYQGLANTFESVASRVGSTFMSYGEARRRRNEERERLKAERDASMSKSMIDAVVKLVPAAVQYEQQKDAFEYKKEQDKLDREFREEEAEKTATYRQSMLEGQQERDKRTDIYRQTMLEGQIARDQRTDAFRTKTFNEQVRSNISRERMETKKFDAILEENKENRSFRQWQKENTANENRLNAEERARNQQYRQDSLNLKKATPLEQSNMANSMAININKSKAQRYSNLYDKYRIWAGMGSLDGKVPPAVSSPNVDSEGNPKMGFADWVEDDVNGLGLPEGYVNDLLTETTYEDVLAQHNIALPAGTPTPKVATDEEDDLTIINKVIEENTPKEEPPPAVANETQSVLESSMSTTDRRRASRVQPQEVGTNVDSTRTASSIRTGTTGTGLNIGKVSASTDVGEDSIPTRQMAVKTRGRNLTIRSSPSSASSKIGSVSNKAQVTVIKIENGWAKVDLGDGSIGYVSARFLNDL